MTITTNSTTVTHVLPVGTTGLAAGSVSLYSTHNGVTTIYAATVVAATSAAEGSLTVTSVDTSNDGVYQFVFNSESNADLNISGVSLTMIARASAIKITPVTSVVI